MKYLLFLLIVASGCGFLKSTGKPDGFNSLEERNFSDEDPFLTVVNDA
jgi:hypothetical protein